MTMKHFRVHAAIVRRISFPCPASRPKRLFHLHRKMDDSFVRAVRRLSVIKYVTNTRITIRGSATIYPYDDFTPENFVDL